MRFVPIGRKAAEKKSDFERTELNKDKTGVCLDGITAINTVNGREIPVWVSDYVLVSYGTGAIMAVPAHDTRDWEFAHKFGLPVIEVVAGGDVTKEAYTDIADGVMVNSGFLDGLRVADAKKKMIEYLTEKGIGAKKVNFKLRDWVFSRQRYWGKPIPVVWCREVRLRAAAGGSAPADPARHRSLYAHRYRRIPAGCRSRSPPSAPRSRRIDKPATARVQPQFKRELQGKQHAEEDQP